MAERADGEVLATGPMATVQLVAQAGVAQEWSGLSIKEQEKLRKRCELVCVATGPLDRSKFRLIQTSDFIAEIKVRRPPIRALVFKDQRVWRVAVIGNKPGDKELPAMVARAERIRNEYFDAQQARHRPPHPPG